MFGRRKIAALAAEFVGTGLLTLAILSVQRSTIGVPFFVAAGAALALAVTTYTMYENSGAHFNPALTIGLWTARKVSTLRGLLYIAMQLLGGIAAYGLYVYFVNSHVQSVGGHYSARVLVAEAVGTAVFTFAITATLYRRFTLEGVAAYRGIAYMLGILIASPAAIGLLNPAVALGDRAWVWGTYVLGPVLGGLVGVNLYNLLFAEPAEIAAGTGAVAAASVSSTRVGSGSKKKSSRTKR